VPQLEILPQTDIFISHGGMNSTMESLYFGVPLIVIPHINEQRITAQRIQKLGLGIGIDEAAVTAGTLKKAVLRIAQEPGFAKRAQAMQQTIREAGGCQRAANALQDYLHAQMRKC
jgi:NDP-glycosyltransferase